MAARSLLFLADLAPLLTGFDPKASETKQRAFLIHLHAMINAAPSKICSRLSRLTIDSPDLLAVIKV